MLMFIIYLFELDMMRKQFLIWRTVSIDMKQRYRRTGEELLHK